MLREDKLPKTAGLPELNSFKFPLESIANKLYVLLEDKW